MKIISETVDEKEIISSLKNIAAAHFIIVLAITGIIGLQITYYIVTKRADNAELAALKKEAEVKKTN